MGSRALVVLACQEKFFYYRGKNMCFEEQEFRSEIHDFLEKLTIWSQTPLQFPKISPKDDVLVYGNIDGVFINIDGVFINIDGVFRNIDGVFINIDGVFRNIKFKDFLSFDNDNISEYIARNEESAIKEMLYIMTQFQICCQPDKLNLVSAKIIQILKV
jgi:hypothetical protein